MAQRKRYALIGAGNRATVYMDALAGVHREHAQLVALCDPSPTRMAWHNQRLAERFNHAPLALYAPKDFERMLAQEKVDVAIITVPDYLHHEYAIRAMNGGADVICEKPVTIDAPKLKALFETKQRTGRDLRVTLNARYAPEMIEFKRMLQQGAVGTPLAIEFTWNLDTSHGADYFRRWHREKDKSGGLLVHKASHHFDLANWFAGSFPKRVFAQGDLKFYGKAAAAARGETYAYDRYTGAPEAANDPFAIRLDADEQTRKLYLEAEKDSGYVRDRNVFGEGITIEDTLSLSVRYRNGVLMTYSLLAYSPWEGIRLAVTGTRGRLELYSRLSAHIPQPPPGREAEAEAASKPIRRITHFPMFGVPTEIDVPEGEGTHAGADLKIMNDLFSPTPGPDPLGCRCDPWTAAASVLVGISGNRSIQTGQAVDCDEILRLPER